MSNIIVRQASDFKLTDFFNSFQNYVPSNIYNENWYVELKMVIKAIKENNLNDKYDFTDKRIVMIAYKALEKVETPGSELEWFLAKNYVEAYTKTKEQKSKDLLEFINLFIGFNFTSAEKDEKAQTIESKLKNSLSSFINSGELEIPKFIKSEIIGKVELATKPDIEFAPEPADDVIDDTESETKEIKKQLAFAEMMFEDELTTKKEKEQWAKRIKMLNLLLT